MSRPDFSKSFAQNGEEDELRWRTLHGRLVDSCRDVWVAVKDILCLDSPEGHTPIESEIDDLDVGIKDTLSFSWRALKEARFA